MPQSLSAVSIHLVFSTKERRPFLRDKSVREKLHAQLGVSNGWLKEQGPGYADFEWQGGYSDFSVSQSNLDQVKEYIAEQEEHHRKMTFQDELRALLRKHEIEFDERYVWD